MSTPNEPGVSWETYEAHCRHNNEAFATFRVNLEKLIDKVADLDVKVYELQAEMAKHDHQGY